MIHIHTCIHTYIHTNDLLGYIGHTTTNLQPAIAVTVLGTMRVVIPVLRNAPSPILRRELSAANDNDTKDEQDWKATDSSGRGSGRGEVYRYSYSRV